MASTNAAAKPMQKILDPTKLAGLKSFVRKPIIDPKKPIQGKVRETNSNAFKEYAAREAVRLQKALNSAQHGKHIFVYHNVRTKQVVYSLTRYLEENNMLRQMVFHGKKTVPAQLRRDMWAPFYSVHFSDPRLGLRAYQLLREFSLQRQLSPPQEMITVTKEFLALKRPKDPAQAEDFDKMHNTRIGVSMTKKERARTLMDQKATSVADIAAVLAIQEEDIANGFLSEDRKRGKLTRKAAKRRRDAAAYQAVKHEEYANRIAALEANLSEKSGVEVKIGTKSGEFPETADSVKLLWRDIHDAHFAEKWPISAVHGELEITRGDMIGSEKNFVEQFPETEEELDAKNKE
ncbi:hypothetical protein N7495_005971 [Penicillium taxi]|uniref:uncharacterized protein n=1 Tax=Penicillium taxi TaxID=168475 RepID=UPI002545597D|nr:uncharacterized protein N7495_005971 [Penicillium taxi]KAJ5894280.1 hypothetical protein N7495_005971 [Penicillium taxi]